MTRLTGKAFVDRMNAAKAAKHRESQRFPERATARHAGPQLTGPKIDGRISTAPEQPNAIDTIIAKNIKKMTPAPEGPAAAGFGGADWSAAAAAGPSGAGVIFLMFFAMIVSIAFGCSGAVEMRPSIFGPVSCGPA